MPKKILLVDDDPDILDMLADGLSDTFDVEVASDGSEAWDKYLLAPPDAVIADIKMPIMGGIELIEKIRSKDPTTIIAISGVDPEGLRRALAVGANMAIEKPFDVKRVRDLISSD